MLVVEKLKKYMHVIVFQMRAVAAALQEMRGSRAATCKDDGSNLLGLGRR